MRLRPRAFAIAAKVVSSGDFPELLRRIRVRFCGNLSVTPPEFSAIDTAATVGAEDEAVSHQSANDCASLAQIVPSEPIRCLMFAHNLNLEGAPTSQFELTKALVERGVIAPEVVAFNDGPMRTAYEGIGVGVTVVPPCLERISTLARLEKVVDELVDIIHRKSARVVYANTLLTFAAVIAAEKAGVASVWNPRESEPWDTYFGFLNEPVAQRALTSFAMPYRVVFVAEATRRAWSKFNVRRNFTVIRNGLDTRRFGSMSSVSDREEIRRRLGYASGDVIFLCIGTLCERKGQLDLVQAFALLQGDSAQRARLCLVGDEHAGYGTLLRSAISKLPSSQRAFVKSHPATPDINDYYRAADAFVLCSRVESYPRVILEAMAHGLPVIATPVFGVLEQVEEHANALIFEPGDIRELACKLKSMTEDERLRNRLALGSVERLQQLLTFDEMVEAYGKVIVNASRVGERRQ